MKIVLAGTTAVHQVMVAAYLYLGRIDGPEFDKVIGFCDMSWDYNGYPVFVDEEKGCQVFTLGLGRYRDIGIKTIESFKQLLLISDDQVKFHYISLPGEILIWLLGKMDRFSLGHALNRMISTRIIRAQFQRLKKTVESI